MQDPSAASQEPLRSQRQDQGDGVDSTHRWSFRRRGAHIQAEKSARLWDLLCGNPKAGVAEVPRGAEDAGETKKILTEIYTHRQRLYKVRRNYDAAAVVAGLSQPGRARPGACFEGPSDRAARVSVSATVQAAKKLLSTLSKQKCAVKDDDRLLMDGLTQYIQTTGNLTMCMAELVRAADESASALEALDARQRNFVSSVMAMTCEMNKGFPPFWDLGPLAPGIYGWKQREVDKDAMRTQQQ